MADKSLIGGSFVAVQLVVDRGRGLAVVGFRRRSETVLMWLGSGWCGECAPDVVICSRSLR